MTAVCTPDVASWMFRKTSSVTIVTFTMYSCSLCPTALCLYIGPDKSGGRIQIQWLRCDSSVSAHTQVVGDLSVASRDSLRRSNDRDRSGCACLETITVRVGGWVGGACLDKQQLKQQAQEPHTHIPAHTACGRGGRSLGRYRASSWPRMGSVAMLVGRVACEGVAAGEGVTRRHSIQGLLCCKGVGWGGDDSQIKTGYGVHPRVNSVPDTLAHVQTEQSFRASAFACCVRGCRAASQRLIADTLP